MHSTHSASKTDNSRESPAEQVSLWARLQESVERLSTTGRQRFAPEAIAQKLASRAKLLRGRMDTQATTIAPLIVLAFNQGSQRYGIPITAVLEVTPLEHFCPVPKTPPFLRGVTAWRGGILTLLDLGQLFGITESGLADLHAAIIVETAGKRIAVVVREVEDLFSISKEQLKTAPELPGGVSPEWVLGVHDDNRMILRMDVILQDPRLVAWRNP